MDVWQPFASPAKARQLRQKYHDGLVANQALATYLDGMRACCIPHFRQHVEVSPANDYDDTMIRVTPDITLDESEIEEHFIRASGHGGQNVNMVATAVQLRFDALHSPSLTGPVRTRLLRLAGKRVTQNGVIVITAQRFRTQHQNREDALNRLIELIRQAASRPRPRIKTRPTKGSQRRRLESKRRHSTIKRQRRATGHDDD